MRLPSFRIALCAVIVVSASFVMADQKIKTKSNIKNDRLAETSSSAACADQKDDATDKTGCKPAITPTADSESSTSSVPSKAVDTSKPL